MQTTCTCVCTSHKMITNSFSKTLTNLDVQSIILYLYVIAYFAILIS